ncbi:hypothetical protein G7062_10660 [Erysipelothrix sp. HDW6C]|uniref:hypothetical protein n=1 Tax=Erysipelothrix sp. HDW6C TaxID=2714930 RepID=UPI00140CF346|nr:hypothetical protein [Erysipelothrix sp. HDW6C]QIK70730.1 hypothetical protein G7062_10660 [Erysipelothrix sp. HDW6C]
MKIKPTGTPAIIVKVLAGFMLLASVAFGVRCFTGDDVVLDFTGALFTFIGAWLVHSEISSDFVVLNDDSFTITRRYYNGDKLTLREDTILYHDVQEIGYGFELKVPRMEKARKARFGWYSPKEIIFITDTKKIPWNCLSYSKKDIATLLNHIQAKTDVTISEKLTTINP